MTWLKVCGLTNRADVKAAAAAGVDALGFVLVPSSPRAIGFDMAADLIPGVEQTSFLLTLDLDPEALVAAALTTGATGVQPYGRFADTAAAAAAEVGLMVLRPVTVGSDCFAVPAGQYPLFDAKHPNGSGPAPGFDYDLLPTTDRPFVIAGGVAADNVAGLITRHHPFGVDVSSSLEKRPGVKDHALIEKLVAAVRGS